MPGATISKNNLSVMSTAGPSPNRRIRSDTILGVVTFSLAVPHYRDELAIVQLKMVHRVTMTPNIVLII